MKKLWIGFLILVMAVVIPCGHAQMLPAGMLVSNRLEYRLMDDRREAFDDLFDLDYSYGAFTAGLRLELHQPSNARALDSLTQRFFIYQNSMLTFRVGNFYKRLGKGLVFHAFEKQQISLDRINQSFYVDRNLDGVSVNLSGDRFDISLFSGKPSWMADAVFRGGEAVLRLVEGLDVGGSYLRANTRDFVGSFHSETVSGHAAISQYGVDLTGEFARRFKPDDRDHPAGRAIYMSANAGWDAFGLSVEYKDYRHFATTYNTPPTLIREHTFSLLNRNSHIVHADDERGFQIEAFASPWTSTSLVLNYSRADDRDGATDIGFYEAYAEITQEVGEALLLRGVVDQMQDRGAGTDLARTGALEIDWFLNARNSILVEAQIQRMSRFFIEGGFWNHAFQIAFSRSPHYALGVQVEKTTDPFQDKQTWIAANLNIKMGDHHDLYVTYGARRGGLACSSGVCQVMPEFSGLEVRLYSRF